MSKIHLIFLFCTTYIALSLPVCAQYAQNDKWLHALSVPENIGRETTFIIQKDGISADVLEMEIEKTMKNFLADNRRRGSVRVDNTLYRRDSEGRLVLELTSLNSGFDSMIWLDDDNDPRKQWDKDIRLFCSRCEVRCQARDGRYRMDILFSSTPTTLKGLFYDICFHTYPSLSVDATKRQDYDNYDEQMLEAVWRRYTIQKTPFGITDKQRDGVQYDNCFSKPEVGLPNSNKIKRFFWADLVYDKHSEEMQKMICQMIFWLACEFDDYLDAYLKSDIKNAVDAAKNDAW